MDNADLCFSNTICFLKLLNHFFYFRDAGNSLTELGIKFLVNAVYMYYFDAVQQTSTAKLWSFYKVFKMSVQAKA